MSATAHVDTFARNRLPARQDWPELVFGLPSLQYPPRVNVAHALLQGALDRGYGQRPALLWQGGYWTYAQLLDQARRIARVLTRELGMIPGNRVLLRSANTPMLAASLFGIWLAGGIAVPTMPMLRAPELKGVINKAQIGIALCAVDLGNELALAREGMDCLKTIVYISELGFVGHEYAMDESGDFVTVDTAIDDICLIAFTSGTTGTPKGTIHFHRDLLAACDCFPAAMLKPTERDIFTGTPPLAFTFGLGGLLLFPLRFGAATVLVPRPLPEALLQAIEAQQATICFTAPTFYRQMAPLAARFDLASLRHAVSAGEPLPCATRTAWEAATGVRMTDGIGSTEMLHIFISASGMKCVPERLASRCRATRPAYWTSKAGSCLPG